MLLLTKSLSRWNTDTFSRTLKDELQGLDTKQLPLQKGTSQGGHIGEDNITVTVNAFQEHEHTLEGSVGVFFTEIVINCGCGDDPMEINAYCDLSVSIDTQTAATTFEIIAD